MVKMNAELEKAFGLFEQCMTSLGKGLDKVVEDIITEKGDGTRIRIKKGSTVFIGKGVYAKLSSDVEAEIVEDPKKEKAEK